ncbi:MAG: CBS domain-containing protein [Alphaproteobacteria bacterium]|nr:CBS domain-containing protein [Alphaproteobacteria bacterium]
MSVSHILKSKGRDVITAKAGDHLHEIAQTLSLKRIGAIVIISASGKIEGIVSERDVVRCLAAEGAKALDVPVSKIMTKGVKTCNEHDSETELMALMTENRIRHLPVVAGDKLVGMISIGDVVKFRIEAIEREAADMKAYIAGS